MTDYRIKIYKSYSSQIQNASSEFNIEEADRWGRAYNTYLRSWLPGKKDTAILDVACGGGKLLHFLKNKGYTNLQGIDISPEQVALARQVTENVVCGDAIEFLKSQKAAYDLIAGLDIIEHFKKDEVFEFLEGCYNALRSGGRLILQTFNAESPWGSYHRYNDITHEIGFNPNSLKRLIVLAGFSDIMSRETGPVVHGLVSMGRFFMWKLIHTGLTVWNLAETGSKGSGIYTRVFIMTGKRI